MIPIVPDNNDDPCFIKIVEKFTNTHVENLNPDEVYVIKIDSWFDFKWRDFSGKIMGAIGMWDKENLRVPPFIPDRVVKQVYFVKEKNNYEQYEVADLHIYQDSSNNITGNRRLVAPLGTRLFFWYTGNTSETLRGSIMMYHVEKEDHCTLYVSFMKKNEWQIFKTDGISRNAVLAGI